MTVVLLLVGIVLVIVDTNGILMVDQWIIYLVFGLSAFLFLLPLLIMLFASIGTFVHGNILKGRRKRFEQRFDRDYKNLFNTKWR